jgi:hypothetical protein
MRILLQLCILYIGVIGCKNDTTKKSTKINDSESAATKHRASELPTFDTVIKISSHKNFKPGKNAISSEEAKAFLYKHFRQKGILPRNEYENLLRKGDKALIVTFNKSYPIASDKYVGAVLSFWIGPPDLNGLCYQPSKAFILHTANGYRILAENFIPKSYSIDSTKGNILFGYEFECGGRGMVRKIRAFLE